jgi:hypothetical protein
LITPFRAPWTPISVYYVFAPYVTAGLTMAVYTRSAAVVDIPHINPVIDFNAVNIHIACESTAFNWAYYFRVESILTPRILILKLSFTSLSLITTLASILNFFNILVRCISSYFFGLNLDPWRFAHVSHALYVRSSVWQFPYVINPYVRILTSSTNPIRLILRLAFSQSSSRSIL